MRGDFSRFNFKKDKHYNAVLMQQGRVQVDADWNEQQRINNYYSETKARDVIGIAGVPKMDGAPNYGFMINISSDKKDLLISRGHIYVDGILCEANNRPFFGKVSDKGDRLEIAIPKNEGLFLMRSRLLGEGADAAPRSIVEAKFEKRKYVVALKGGVAGLAPGLLHPFFIPQTYNVQPDYYPLMDKCGVDNLGNGDYLVYLDVWERHLTALEDPDIRETALGGPDTCTRSKIVWQVKLARTEKPPDGAVISGWIPPNVKTTNGSLTAWVQNGKAGDSSGVMLPGSGYAGLENQLYRIEVHEGGLVDPTSKDTVTFKWQKDNGSVCAAVKITDNKAFLDEPEGGKSSSVLDAKYVELLDDRIEVNGLPGSITIPGRRVDAETKEVKLEDPGDINNLVNPRLRCWDGKGTIKAKQRLTIEKGLFVKFAEGYYRTGDYWLIPARTGTGNIEWPRNASGEPLSEQIHGIYHHYCPLAVVTVVDKTFAAIRDLRQLFPPLTNITARDVRYDNQQCNLDTKTVQDAIEALCRMGKGICTYVVSPDMNLKVFFDRLNANNNVQHARICFQAGAYKLSDVITIKNKGYIHIEGAGAATDVQIADSEAAFYFEACLGVTIRDLSASTIGSAKSVHQCGVVTFVNCSDVDVESVKLHCDPGIFRSKACITVRPLNEQSYGAAYVTIKNSSFTVGDSQTGILLVNVSRTHLEGNVINLFIPIKVIDFKDKLQDPAFRAQMKKLMVSNIAAAEKEPPAGTYNVAVKVGNHKVFFMTPTYLNKAWQPLINRIKPAGINNSDDLKKYVSETLTEQVLTNNEVRKLSRNMASWYTAYEKQDEPVAYQGIVVAGRMADDIRILNNSLRGFTQGIHLGVSHEEKAKGAPDLAECALISGNRVAIKLTAKDQKADNHGIFVGNCRSLVMENNYISVSRSKGAEKIRHMGIIMYGFYGNRVIVRHNHLMGSISGIYFNPLNLKDSKINCQWLLADNVAPASRYAVEINEYQPKIAQPVNNVPPGPNELAYYKKP